MSALTTLGVVKQSASTASKFRTQAVAFLPGLVLGGCVAGVSIALGTIPWLASHGMGALTIAIVLGILLGNTVYPRIALHCDAGVLFSKQTLLRLGIILYGLRLTFQDIGQVGVAGVAIDAMVLSSTFGIALLLGTKVFKLDRHTSILIGAGSSICGAAAVMATEPVVRARAEQVTVAVSTVVVFGTLAIFLYPLLYRLNLQWHLLDTSPSAFGIYAGSTIHEVAQVVAAARSINQEATNTAVIAKMVRVMMLAPFLIILSTYLARERKVCTSADRQQGNREPATPLAIPWFAFVFIAMVGLNSAALLPQGLVAQGIEIDTWMLAMAMAALGLTTHISAIRRAGIKPLLLALMLFAWLMIGGAAINRVGMALLG